MICTRSVLSLFVFCVTHAVPGTLWHSWSLYLHWWILAWTRTGDENESAACATGQRARLWRRVKGLL